MVRFEKYQGTGNDFIMIDNRDELIDRNNLDFVRKWCDRKFGVGADGLILIENHPDYDFELVYFNSDGSQSFCGNGSRCGVRFAQALGLIEKQTTFLAIDGVHEAFIDNNDLVHLKMNDVFEVERGENYTFLNTGSPHYIIEKEDLSDFDLLAEARSVRYNGRFKAEGTNVNFVQVKEDGFRVRTYERGVEDETLSCGTGVTAVAISKSAEQPGSYRFKIYVEGGVLEVSYHLDEDGHFTDVYLIGPGEKVFEGVLDG